VYLSLINVLGRTFIQHTCVSKHCVSYSSTGGSYHRNLTLLDTHTHTVQYSILTYYTHTIIKVPKGDFQKRFGFPKGLFSEWFLKE